MSWQHWDPPAIIIPAPPRAEIFAPATQKEKISAEEHFKKVYDTPWNALQPDGRINMGDKGSASVSPYSIHFRSQIEDGIWPLVEVFYSKGYLPVSSCEGHKGSLLKELGSLTEYHSGAYVSIAINRSLEQSIVESLSKLANKHTEISVTRSMSNMDASLASTGIIKKRRSKANIENEYLSLNWMFQRRYDEWSYVTVRINPWKKYSLLYALRTQKEHQMIVAQAEQYKKLENYLF